VTWGGGGNLVCLFTDGLTDAYPTAARARRGEPDRGRRRHARPAARAASSTTSSAPPRRPPRHTGRRPHRAARARMSRGGTARRSRSARTSSSIRTSSAHRRGARAAAGRHVSRSGPAGRAHAHLAGTVGRLVLVELDDALAAALAAEYAAARRRPSCTPTSCARRSARQRDVHALKVVGNIPYNITTPIIFRLLERSCGRSASCS
jgi:hypothetical protein